jgi:hypothetical protein
VDLYAAKPVQLDPYSLAVSSQQLFPGRISQPNGHFGGVDDVGDEQGRNEALARFGWLRPAVHAAVLDCHKRLLADHPRVVPRRDLERLAGAENPSRASIGFDLYLAFEDNALVMVLAAGRPGHRFHMLGPAPSRLVDEAGDVRLAEKHDLNGYERKSDELIRFVESLRLEPRHLFRLRLGHPGPPGTSRHTRKTSPRQTPLVPLLVDRLLETLLVVTVAVVVLLLVRERRTTGPPPIGSIGTRGAALATHRVLLSRSGQTLH